MKKAAYQLSIGDSHKRDCLYATIDGISRSCDILIETAGDLRALEKQMQHHGNGPQALHLPSSLIGSFAETVLPKLKTPTVLVTSCEEELVTPEKIGAGAFEALANNEHLCKWYGQNLAIEHPKMHPLPTGPYYSALLGNVRCDQGDFASPVACELKTLYLRRELTAQEQRPPSISLVSKTSLQMRQNTTVIDAAKSTEAYYRQRIPAGTVLRTSRETTYEKFMVSMADSFFVLPEEAGHDGAAIWQAVLLGSVPIVKRSSLSRLYDGLPILQVENWAQLTPNSLRETKAKMLRESYCFAPLYLEYWRDRISEVVPRNFPSQSFQEFLATDLKNMFSMDAP